MIAKIYLAIYHLLAPRAWLRWLLMLVSLALFVALGLQVRFEEDITKLLPTSESGNESIAFSQLKVKDKIFLLVTSRDPSEPLSPDDLADVTDQFCEQLFDADSTTLLIDDILSGVDEEDLLDLIDYLGANYPLFVDTADYAEIAALCEPESVADNVAGVRQLLASTSGMAFKSMLAADPIGLRKLVLADVKEIRDGMGSQQTIYNGHLFTPDTTVALCYIAPSFKSYDSGSGHRLVEMIEDEIERCHQANPDVRILFHGAPVQSVCNSRQIKRDLGVTLTVSLLLVCLAIGVCFRNKSTIPLLLCPIVYGAFFALAAIFLIKGSMSLMALGLGAIVLGVALSYCLHVITHYKYVSDPERVIREQSKPVTLGCLTTIGSFMGLLLTSSELLSDFGLFSSLGLAGTTFFALVFMPHFFNPQRNRRQKQAFALLEKFNSHRFEKHTWLIAAILVAVCVCLYTQRFVTFDSDLRNISYTSPALNESKALLASKTQPGLVTYYYGACDADLDQALAKSRGVHAVLDSLKREGLVKGYSRASTIFPTLAEQEVRREAWRRFWTPERLAQVTADVNDACQRQGIDPAFFAPFQKLVKADYPDVSPYDDEVLPPALLSNIIEANDSLFLVFTSASMRDADKTAVGKRLVADTDCIVADPMFYSQELVESINADFHTVLNISMAFVFVILLLSFRDLLLAVVAFLPMTLSWFIVLGFMGLFGMQFNLINIVISTFVFGIGVDYSIFVMDGLLSKARSQAEPHLLVYHKTAIFLSAFVLMVTIGSLLLADHPALESVGVATIIGMSSAVVLAYTLQPFLYHLIVKLLLRTKWHVHWLGERN